MKQKITEPKREVDKSTVTAKDLNTYTPTSVIKRTK